MSILPRICPVWLCSIALLAGLSETTLANEQFVLQVPGQRNLTSTAIVSQQQLTITDSQNQTFNYQRRPQLDTPDGRYWGYFSQAAGQTLRWPTNHAGAMLIGDANGQNWRPSQQQIQAVGAAAPHQPNTVTTRRPVFDQTPHTPQGGFQNPLQGRVADQAQQRYSGPMEVAYSPAGNQALDVGYIGPQGDLQLYRGWRDQWQPHQQVNGQPLQQAGLLPGAPLSLVSQQGQQVPSAYTVNSGGRLVEIANGNQVRQVADNVQFSPRSHLHVRPTDRGAEGFAVDAQGRLLNLNLATGQHQMIDQNPGRFSAGAPLAMVSQQMGRGSQDDLYLVDRTGQIVNYSAMGGQWNGPHNVAAGFPPGAPLAATTLQMGGRNQVRLAGVDVRGQVQTLGHTHAGWQAQPIQGTTLPPGSPLAFTQAGANLALSGVGPGGVWNDWNYASGQWNPSVVNRGFLTGAPLVADPFSQTAFGVDATGRLVTGGYWDNDWHSHLLMPGLDYASPLVRRNVVARSLRPATVFFDNSSPEELVVQLVDPLTGRPGQFNIPPGGSVPYPIPRDGGGMLEEAYLVPGLGGGWIERLDSFPLPPQPGPTAVVWSKRVTYSYIDRKNISVVPDFDMKTHVSLGVFDLPPGEFLADGDRFDVFREAAIRQNPGAAQWFGLPAPDADIGVPLIRDYGRGQQPLLPRVNTIPRTEQQVPLPTRTPPARTPQEPPPARTPQEPSPGPSEEDSDPPSSPLLPPLPN